MMVLAESPSVRSSGMPISVVTTTRHAAEAAATGMQTAAILQNRALKSVRAMESQETQSPEDLRMADACLTVAGKASALGTQLMQANRDSGKPGQPTLEDIITGKAAS